jgi:hypothetical protein
LDTLTILRMAFIRAVSPAPGPKAINKIGSTGMFCVISADHTALRGWNLRLALPK